MGWLIRFVGRAAVLALMCAGWTMLWGLLEAKSDPVVRRAEIAMADWPEGAAPVTVALLSDLHVGNAATSPERLARIVARVNAARPDLVLIAGDFMPGHDTIDDETAAKRLAPLLGFVAPLGVVAVPGNHDHWTDVVDSGMAFNAANIVLLHNAAIVRGPLAIGGVDDDFSHHADLPLTIARARRLQGARVLLTHSPDIAPHLPGDFGLLLAGHTHCGQAVLPVYGAVASVSRFGERYRCGLIRENGRMIIVTAGTGTSGPPMRFGARPDFWLIRLGPKR